MAILESIQRKAVRNFFNHLIPTEVFMSSLTRFHLADELRRHRANWEVKGKKIGESESNNRVPVDLSFKTKDGSYKVLIRIKESIPTDSFELGFKKMVEVINPTNGRKEYVAQSER